MSKYQAFIFNSWKFDPTLKKLWLRYSYDDVLDFEEEYSFDFDFVDYSAPALERAINNLFFMAGVSYYKAYLAPSIEIRQGSLDAKHADFFGKTYQRGLGEFFYVNKLDPNSTIEFPVNSEQLEPTGNNGEGILLGLGGGKDSLVSVELLRPKHDVTTWTVGHGQQLEPLVEKTALPHLQIVRSWDLKLDQVNKVDALNGHVPISAILACVGTVVAILSGKRDVIVSNERSADEPTLEFKGVSVNHQYSKSSEFEKDYQALLAADFNESIRYYSLLRPLSELMIAKLFAEIGFEKYKTVFSSCNRAFTKDCERLFWCGECPKCAFVYLALAPFIEEAKLIELFGKNLLLEPQLAATYRQLLGINGNKPMECVGEIAESRWAMDAMKQKYPALRSFIYDKGGTGSVWELSNHSIPPEVSVSVANLQPFFGQRE
ncbi:MAG: endonuclease domain-containing protein [Candidatus Saccharimonadales bacterium]